jgi:hypothetical protein
MYSRETSLNPTKVLLFHQVVVSVIFVVNLGDNYEEILNIEVIDQGLTIEN